MCTIKIGTMLNGWLNNMTLHLPAISSSGKLKMLLMNETIKKPSRFCLEPNDQNWPLSFTKYYKNIFDFIWIKTAWFYIGKFSRIMVCGRTRFEFAKNICRINWMRSESNTKRFRTNRNRDFLTPFFFSKF